MNSRVLTLKMCVKLSTVADTSTLEDLIHRASLPSSPERPIHLHGLEPTARAYALAKIADFFSRPLLVLCRSDIEASVLCDNISALDSAFFNRRLCPTLFPHWDASLRQTVSPSIQVRQKRARVLGLLRSNRPPKIVVTTIAGACFATLPPEEFLRLSFSPAGLSRAGVIDGLLRGGYLRVDACEDPGTFSSRGDLLDVFPPAFDRPVRLEYFGDDLEKARPFDPQTQRTSSSEQILPAHLLFSVARETLVNQETCDGIRAHVRSYAETLSLDRRKRDPILHSIAENTYPDHHEGWACWASKTPSTLINHAPFVVAVIDELGCLADWDAFYAEELRLQGLGEESQRGFYLLPPTPELYRAESLVQSPEVVRASIKCDLITLSSARSDGPTSLFSFQTEPITRLLPLHRESSLAGTATLLRRLRLERFKVALFAQGETQSVRLKFLLSQHSLEEGRDFLLYPERLSSGFHWPEEGLLVMTDREVLGSQSSERVDGRNSREDRAKDQWAGLQALADLAPHDLVVHKIHGIGRYFGMTRIGSAGSESDFLHLEYADKDRLYLPVYRLNVIQKYAGAPGSASLDKLGSQQFAKAKEKVRAAVKKIAIDLVDLYAKRKLAKGIRMSPRDAPMQEFESRFPYEETPDQLKAINDTLADLASGQIMDRLICGDVGYGKTEVAMRAAFKAVTDGYQVAVLVPTTVLANQHELSFKARMREYPICIESISRFKSPKEQKEILRRAQDGKVDIVIGTHRLLSKDVRFKNLALIVVDEEHRFGVEHKERLKALKVSTHVLTLTATPIPRTLQMALGGLREITIMNTPPSNRLPIKTFVAKFDEEIIRRAIETELARGGQVFYLHNRVQSIPKAVEDLERLVPGVRVSVGHGQMSEKALETAMLDFYERRSQVLVSTTIIESGLDIPSANTLIVDRADALGLAQLYQIRGRVGRGQERAYAYLLVPDTGGISEDAKKRLDVIQRFVELGSGFSIASHDLEIRGGGDLVGAQQSGHIAAVGFDLYLELLDQAVREQQGKPTQEESTEEPEIKTPFSAYFDENYIPDPHQRLALYRKLASAENDAALADLESELQDRFGRLPIPAMNLFWVIRLKILLKQTGLAGITVGKDRISLVPGKNCRIEPTKMISLVSAFPDIYQLLPDSKLVVRMKSWRDPAELFFETQQVLERLH